MFTYDDWIKYITKDPFISEMDKYLILKKKLII